MNETLTFDAGWLARGWLSVSEASSKDKGRPALDRTMCVEFFGDGVRLVATDSYMLLTTWVPCYDNTNGYTPKRTEPGFDESPRSTVVAIDEDGRAKGLFAFLLKQTEAEGAPEILVTLTTGPAPEINGPALILWEGAAGDCLTIAAADREALLLSTYEGEYPTWRRLVSSFVGGMTPVLALNPDILGRVVKMGKVGGAEHIDWMFGGSIGPAKVQVAGEPTITGLVMPVRWTGTDEVGVNPPTEADDSDDLDITVTHTSADGVTNSAKTTTRTMAADPAVRDVLAGAVSGARS